MKFAFKIFLFASIMYQVNARPIFVLSGQASKSDQILIAKVIQQNLGIPKKYIVNDFKNRKCRKVGDAIIQLCFYNQKFFVAHKEARILNRTLARFVYDKKK